MTTQTSQPRLEKTGSIAATHAPLNADTTRAYDPNGNVISTTDANNHTTTFAYDALNRNTQITDALNHTTDYGYDDAGNRTSITDANNHTSTYAYDELNRLVTVTDALGHSTNYGYDAAGNRTNVTDANNHTTTYTFDAINRMTASADPNGHSTTCGFDAAGNRTFVTDARNHSTTYGYDAANRLTSVTNAFNQTTSYGYDNVGNRTSVTDALNHTTTYTYDEMNRVTAVTDAQTQSTTFGYDAVGNRTTVTDAENRTTAFTFDALNRVTVTTNPANKTQIVTYDHVGNILSQTDETNQTTTFTYDATNRTLTKADALSGMTSFAYDNVGNLLTRTEPGSLVTTYVYDSANRVTAKTVPNGTTTYAYDNANNLITLTTNSGARREYSFDSDNLLASESRYDGQNNSLVIFAFAYDATHNRTSETETRPNQSALTTTHTFDDLNRNTSITDPYGGTTGYTFDAAGTLIGQTDPSGFTTSITPNAANLPETIIHRDASNNVVATTTNTYSNANELESWTTTDPIYNLTLNNNLHYNGNGYVDQANVSHTSANNSPSLTSSLTYKDNNLLDVWTQQGQADDHLFYDGAGRLTCSEYGGNVREFLEYDSNGRREHRTWGFYGSSNCAGVVADPSGALATSWFYKRSTYMWDGNRLVGEDAANCQNIGLPETSCPPGSLYTRTLSYDGDGNVEHVTLVWGGNTTTMDYGWEPGTHHLQSVTRNGSVIATFEYDRLDRIRKFCWSDCHVFSYLGDTDWLAVVRDQYGNLKYRYLYANGRPLRVDIPYVWWIDPWYYRYNARGDRAGFADKGGGGGTGWTSFGAWGDVQYGSTGYYSWNAAWGYLTFSNSLWAAPGDALDGIYYAHGRWYVADTGLWLSPNVKGDYLYGGDGQDPVNVGKVESNAPPQQNPGRSYIYTNWGAIIDTGHFHVGTAFDIIQRVKRGQSVQFNNFDLGFGIGHITVDYKLHPPIQDVYGVALAIWEDYQIKFENSQPYVPLPSLPGPALGLSPSNFATEDLPTDYLAFWAAADADARGVQTVQDDDSTAQEEQQKVIGILGGIKEQSTEGPPHCNGWNVQCDHQNTEFTPRVYNVDILQGICAEASSCNAYVWYHNYHNISWPDDLTRINGKSLVPIIDGSWEVESCQLSGVSGWLGGAGQEGCNHGLK